MQTPNRTIICMGVILLKFFHRWKEHSNAKNPQKTENPEHKAANCSKIFETTNTMHQINSFLILFKYRGKLIVEKAIAIYRISSPEWLPFCWRGRRNDRTSRRATFLLPLHHGYLQKKRKQKGPLVAHKQTSRTISSITNPNNYEP